MSLHSLLALRGGIRLECLLLAFFWPGSHIPPVLVNLCIIHAWLVSRDMLSAGFDSFARKLLLDVLSSS